MAETLQIEIVTPERLLVSDQAMEVQVPGMSGYLGILPGHAPLITELRSGEFSYRRPDGKIERLALHWGFAEILPDKVTVLAERAEKAAEIDVEVAKRQQQMAEEQLKDPNANKEEALRLIERAKTRLEVAGRHDSSMLNMVP
ncbi:MAG TPA: F0F1 ATP synthase subunit epsilon [Terriglobales bacterium]|nr:F0F1 ATP synthase subunit epsilon [Terriglobales bacterium]